jgi:hypothetical protein
MRRPVKHVLVAVGEAQLGHVGDAHEYEPCLLQGSKNGAVLSGTLPRSARDPRWAASMRSKPVERRGREARRAKGSMGSSLKDLIFECHAPGVIFLELLVGKLWRREYLEVVDVAYFLGGIDRNPDRSHWSLLSLRLPQCESLRSVKFAPYCGSKRAAPRCVHASRSPGLPRRQSGNR